MFDLLVLLIFGFSDVVIIICVNPESLFLRSMIRVVV